MDANSSTVVDKERSPGTVLWLRFRDEPTEDHAMALVQHHIPLVKRLVRLTAIYRPHHLDVDDLVQYALMGLWAAIEHFDPQRGVPFEAYAVPRIRGSVRDALRRQDPLSRGDRELLKKLNDITQGHLSRHNEAPDEDTLAEIAGIEVGKLRDVLVRAQPWVSLDAMMDEGQEKNGPYADRLADPRAPDPRRETIRREQSGRFRVAFRQLPDRQQKILYLYYFEDLTLKEVGAIMELTEARICQLHAAALLALKAIMTSQAE